VPDDASSPAVPLSLPALTAVRQFTVSPDGGAVAYIADSDQVDRFELYVREIGGSVATKVSLLQNSFDDVIDFVWAPDGQSLAYRADGIVDDRAELFRVGRTGANHYRVYQSGIASIFVSDGYGWSPDSRYLTCLLQQTTTRFELRLHDASTGVEGASSVLFVPPGRQILDVTFSPDSQWVAMRTDHAAVTGQFEVFRRRTDLSGPALRSNGQVGTTVRIEQYSWSPDSRWLAQRVVSRTAGTPIGINVYEVPSDTSRRVVSSSTLGTMAWAPTRNQLALQADFDAVTNTAAGELRALLHDADADTLQNLSDPFVGGEQLRDDLLAWSPDGAHIAYVTRVAVNDEHTYLAAVGSGQPAVRAMDVQGLEVVTLAWSGTSARLGLLERNQNTAFHPGEWHLVDLAGRSVGRTGSVHTYDTSHTMRWSKDGARAVYPDAAGGIGPDLLRSMRADGTGDVQLTNLAADATQSFAYSSATLP
jgi:Tol biopolymer transport system component